MHGAPAPLVLAQSLGEYGALSGAAAAFQSAMYRVEAALREPRSGVPIAIGVAILAYFLLRRRA